MISRMQAPDSRLGSSEAQSVANGKQEPELSTLNRAGKQLDGFRLTLGFWVWIQSSGFWRGMPFVFEYWSCRQKRFRDVQLERL